MRLGLLIAIAVVVPAVWGWSVYWIIARCWPAKQPPAGAPGGGDAPARLNDYQI